MSVSKLLEAAWRAVCLRAETVLALNRNPDYWVYGRGDVESKRGLDAGEDMFNNISMEERSKFKEETLSNVGGRTSSQRMRRCTSFLPVERS